MVSFDEFGGRTQGFGVETNLMDSTVLFAMNQTRIFHHFDVLRHDIE